MKAEAFRLASQRQFPPSESEIEGVVIDVTETEIERPKQNKKTTTVANTSPIVLNGN